MVRTTSNSTIQPERSQHKYKFTVYIMKLASVLTEVVIDNQNGWGAVPFNSDVDYFGLRVQMRPSVFLKLAAPLDAPPSEEIKAHVAAGGAIGAPFLMVTIPPEWEDGVFSKVAAVRSHEGRNRAHAVMAVEGDKPIEVHLFPQGGLRARDITTEMREALRSGMKAERSDRVVTGPLF